MSGFMADYEADLMAPFGVAPKSAIPTAFSGWSATDVYPGYGTFGGTVAHGNLASNDVRSMRGEKGQTTGKWYFEAQFIGYNPSNVCLGIMKSDAALTPALYSITNAYALPLGNSAFYANGTASGGATSPTAAIYMVIGFAYDGNANKLYVCINGTWQNGSDPVAGTSGYAITAPGLYMPAFSTNDYRALGFLNTGKTPFTFGPPQGYQPWG